MAIALSKIHPAVAVVARIEAMWEFDPRRCADRAEVIVCRLIELGHIEGEVVRGMPCPILESPAKTKAS